MALLLRRGLEADRLSFIPEEGELIYVTDTKLIYVGDGITPGGILVAGGGTPTPSPTYQLDRSSATVDEGSSVTIILTTTNINDGSNIPYTITGTGITAADLGLSTLTGSFTVNSNTASLTLNIANDATTEGNETFTLTLNSITPTVSTSITIIDTSVSPPAPTYQLDRSSATVDEGSSFTITLTTTNVVNGTLVPYTITGVSSFDINGASLSGNFTVNSNTASIIFDTTEDSSTEGNETFTLTLNSITPTVSTSITIIDTSVSPPGGNIEGGNPGTIIFDSVIIGGDPGTTIFDEIIDGGTP